MREAFLRGLHKDPNVFNHSPIKMLPTYLSVVPNGTEVGKFISIDLGGSNFRFFAINIIDGNLSSKALHYPVLEIAMTGDRDDLFDFMAKCIKESLIKLEINVKIIEFLGFTFSFPVKQLALNSGIATYFTKGFCTKNVVGHDVVALMTSACKKLELKILDYVLINDTTGTLLCGAFENPDTIIGIINGTGTNACYIENIDKVKKYESANSVKQLLINTEWGSFGEDGGLNSILTKFDINNDSQSINSGKQILEKLCSGMYLGEIARLIFISFENTLILFVQEIPEELKIKNSFPTSYISKSYDKNEFIKCFKETYHYDLNDIEYHNIAYVCDIVSYRSACLSAIGLAAIIQKMGVKRGTIAGDGSMFKLHPRFLKYVEQVLTCLVDGQFTILLVEDGSGKGAALAACVASSNKHNSTLH
uniref:Phosphotransferase n=1 Tax=Henneguya salminicola TaxID=69463 RepID=A0A6G3MEY4_HENSL